MRTSERFLAVPGTVGGDEPEVIELTKAKPRKSHTRVAMPALTLLGPGVAAREPERTVHVDPSLWKPHLAIVPDRAPGAPDATPPHDQLGRDTIVQKPQLEIVPDAVDAEIRAEGSGRWSTFEKIGLTPKRITNRLSKLVVSTYRLIGFAILTLIVTVLVGYIGSTLFYFFNHTWMSPVVVSASDEKVITAKSQLLAAQDTRDKTAAELAQTDRVIAAHKAFQGEFARAIKGDRDDRAAALARLQALAQSAAGTRAQIRATSEDYAAQSQARMEKEYEAGLIDRNAALSGKFQVAQIAGANLSLAERQAEYEQRAAELAAQASALDAIASGKGSRGGLTYDVLKIKRDYETSRLDLAKALADRDVLKASLARQDQTLADLKQGAYLRAVDEQSTVALVPYKNLENVAPGTPLYACRLGFVMCREVGTVVEILRGEIQFKHPRRDEMVRGQMVRLELSDAAAAREDVLFVGGRPLGI
jgi:hypothetical protein